MPSEQQTREALRAWVTSKAKPREALQVSDTAQLFEHGHLTSVHVPELLLLIERLRGEPVDPACLGPGDFRDINTIVRRFCTPRPKCHEGGDAHVGSTDDRARGA
jgi:hypothetical protein